MATATARFSTKTVLSLKSESMLWKGRVSCTEALKRMKKYSFSRVLVNKLDTPKVTKIPKNETNDYMPAVATPYPGSPKNKTDSIIKVGNLPLQGTKQLVKMAISLPVVIQLSCKQLPGALQPNPMLIVRSLLPMPTYLLKQMI